MSIECYQVTFGADAGNSKPSSGYTGKKWPKPASHRWSGCCVGFDFVLIVPSPMFHESLCCYRNRPHFLQRISTSIKSVHSFSSFTLFIVSISWRRKWRLFEYIDYVNGIFSSFLKVSRPCIKRYSTKHILFALLTWVQQTMHSVHEYTFVR